LAQSHDYVREIAHLEQMINASTKGVTTEGVRTDFDLDQARRRLAELRRLSDPNHRSVRPVVSSLNLGGCF
jgi:hypothetical protein